jgi:nicotinamide riboside kinase
LREHPEMRRELFDMYQNLLIQNHCNYLIISGTGDDRLQNAIKLIDEFLQQ